ncbi:MAG: hypothetical protein AB2A00_16980 [Myxococcota bacterium]
MSTQVESSSGNVASLRELMRGRPTLAAVAAHLEALPRHARVHEIRALTANQVRDLWQLATAAAPLTVDDMAPASLPPFQAVSWQGRNSMPAFAVMEKRFFRDREGQVWGCNVQGMEWATGPGYFALGPHPERQGELLIDYSRLPSLAPPGWPAITPNSRGLSFLVFHNLRDEMRRVCEGVVIGKATRNGKETGLAGAIWHQYFAMALQDAPH